jgi:hypothetical protein
MGWRVRVKCDARGENWRAIHRDPTVPCHSTHELDMKTLVWTRGALPIDELRQRLKCPICGSREILVYFEVPNEPATLSQRQPTATQP